MADFQFRPGQPLTWADGDNAEQCVFSGNAQAGSVQNASTLTIFGDAAIEGDEVICLKLLSIAGSVSINPEAKYLSIIVQDLGAHGGPKWVGVGGWRDEWRRELGGSS